MYIVITKNKIYVEKNIEDFKKHELKLDLDEFTCIGDKYVANLNNVDVDFCRDKHKISNLIFSNIYKKEKSNNLILYIIVLMQLILLVK